jgi:hypothetical protein
MCLLGGFGESPERWDSRIVVVTGMPITQDMDYAQLPSWAIDKPGSIGHAGSSETLSEGVFTSGTVNDFSGIQ